MYVYVYTYVHTCVCVCVCVCVYIWINVTNCVGIGDVGDYTGSSPETKRGNETISMKELKK